MLAQERIRDFKFIDKTKSEIDEELSDASMGLFFFDPENRTEYQYKLGGKIGEHWFHWIRNDPTRINKVMLTKGYRFVTKDDDVVPEGMPTNSEKRYQYGDLVLMRCSFREYLLRRLRSKKKAEDNFQGTIDAFKAKAGTVIIGDGAEDLIDQIIDDLASAVG